ncbi:pilus assembly protein [Nocardioides carbamazepini]|uniref:TadE/TadG family type IV pilus assembly protein n=1 Tax=Nocardioides carbamazepini TaxID=2854259 RepID=UPI00214A373C|nr:TadE family protein [Nocardioides carbamazepini]MCR1782486.1 pilus assembly protein [Nocardioides carbamazepini]
MLEAGGSSRERGAAAVEFALILPVLMLIVVGIINYGDMLSVRQSVSQAASEGARAAAVTPGADGAKIDAAKVAARAAVSAQGQNCADPGCPAVSIAACAGESTKQCATVTVEIAYKGLIPGFGLILPDKLKYTAVARVS